jgi:hypothetical protein
LQLPSIEYSATGRVYAASFITGSPIPISLRARRDGANGATSTAAAAVSMIVNTSSGCETIAT